MCVSHCDTQTSPKQFPLNSRVKDLPQHSEVETQCTLEHSVLATKERGERNEGRTCTLWDDGKEEKEEKGMREGHAQSGIPSFQNFSSYTLKPEGV